MKKKSLKYKHFVAVTQNICPMLSSYYFSKYKLQKNNKNKKDENDSKEMFRRCVFCCSKFSDGNYSVRITPKPAINNKIKRLLAKHNTDSSNLGKYQTKIVNDYIHGRNKLNIICHVCKKSTKVAGISRDEKIKIDLHRREKLNLQEEIEDVKVPSKKEKKKEKKKMIRKRKAAGVLDEDITAGLILPNMSQPVESSDGIDNRLHPSIPEPVKDDTAVQQSKDSTHSNESKSWYKNEPVRLKDTNQRTLSLGMSQRNTQNYTREQIKQVTKLVGDLGGMNSLSKPLPGVQKAGNKKQKSKKMSKQLGNILKQEQEKKTGGTLADFLSSI